MEAMALFWARIVTTEAASTRTNNGNFSPMSQPSDSVARPEPSKGVAGLSLVAALFAFVFRACH